MDHQTFLNDMRGQRSHVERDLAVGNRRRARRRTAHVIGTLVSAYRRLEPELSCWLRILASLALVERPRPDAQQLTLWPELQSDPPGDSSGETAVRRPVVHPPAAVGLGVITQDGRMLRSLRLLEQLAPTTLPVLVEGESGTGKEVVAQAIHAMSRRGRKPWIAVNCGAMPPQLQESELFGHARGAFTGATCDKPGLFEAAHGGTLFLDEVGEMDLRAQVKLLRVLETGELRRLGEIRMRRVDVRVIAATNADVDRAVQEGSFRKDLKFRLGAVRAWLPPLRERRADILPLAHHFIRRAAAVAPPLTPGARAALLAYTWPGNVRELKFVVERATVLWEQSCLPEIQVQQLFPDEEGPPEAQGAVGPDPASAMSEMDPLCLPAGAHLDRFLSQVERRLIEDALRSAEGNRTRAALLLGGLSRTTLISKMKRLGLFEPAQA